MYDVISFQVQPRQALSWGIYHDDNIPSRSGSSNRVADRFDKLQIDLTNCRFVIVLAAEDCSKGSEGMSKPGFAVGGCVILLVRDSKRVSCIYVCNLTLDLRSKDPHKSKRLWPHLRHCLRPDTAIAMSWVLSAMVSWALWFPSLDQPAIHVRST
jgi:hypothetical protein